ncbi:MAG TPA: allantoinase AllB [Vicinamibacterales bacterium]|nr:allantoinase AllB [Vicinamibacterales bacterium]
MERLVIRSERVVTPAGTRPATVQISNGRIVRLGAIDDVPAGVPVDDAASLVVMPGLVDTHVHLNEPGRSDWEGFETGTAAAAAGGVTTVVDMPLNSLPPTTSCAGLEAKRRAARGRIHVDVAFWGGVVPGNTGELSGLAAAGVAGFKAFLVPSGVEEFPAVSASDLEGSLPVLASLRLPLLVHAESPGAIARASAPVDGADPRRYSTWLRTRPDAAETDAVGALVGLCRGFRTWIHVVHLSTPAAAGMVAAAQLEGLPVTGETCPHYLTFADDEIPDGATWFKCAPPIRSAAHREGLWQAVAASGIDLLASDHSPCPPTMKCSAIGDFLQAWGGIGSLELSLPAVWTGASRRGVPLEKLSRLLSGAPARLAGLGSRKGRLAPGFDADVVVWDPDAMDTVNAESLHQRHKITPYAGMILRGRVERTYLRGKCVYRRADPAGSFTRAGQLLERNRQ